VLNASPGIILRLDSAPSFLARCRYTRTVQEDVRPNDFDDALDDGRGDGTNALVPRILGFDVGDRRIGLAISDPLGYTAQPLFTLHRTNRRADLKWLARVLRKHAVTEAVVGNPLYMSGDQSPQAAKAQAFAEDLRTEFGLTVHLWDERLTTTQAHRHLDDAGHAAMGRKGIIDQVAAVLILQSFLEARASRRSRP
jgi:putative Holliday junction resolvase